MRVHSAAYSLRSIPWPCIEARGQFRLVETFVLRLKAVPRHQVSHSERRWRVGGNRRLMLYAIGDIHGELEKLDELLDSLPLSEGDRLVFLGDYVDRGRDSFGVIERLIRLQSSWPCVFLLGNHESMFLDFLGWTDTAYFGGDAFLLNGGNRTLESYGLFDRSEVKNYKLPQDHENFLLSLKLYHREGDYLFVHAGINRDLLRENDVGYVLHKTRVEDLLWNRSTCELPHNMPVTIVYGHTPSEDFKVRWNLPFNVGIDTGAVFGGPLTALRLPDEKLFQV
jgi:serine/threonine protein phosphatase 1